MKKHKTNGLKILLISLVGVLFVLCVVLCVLVTKFSVLRAEVEQDLYAQNADPNAETTRPHLIYWKNNSKKTSEEEPGNDPETDPQEMPTFKVLSQEPGQFSGHILIGDSRMVMLQRSADYAPTDVFICKGAMACDWFLQEAVPQLRNILNNDPDYAVIINMGVNDCANNCAGWTDYFVKDYVEAIDQLCMDYPFTKFYFASVGHIKNYYMSARRALPEEEVNTYVDIFNSYMKENCLCYYIDVCEHLDEVGYVWADNVHYATATSQEIYDYIVMKVNANNPDL